MAEEIDVSLHALLPDHVLLCLLKAKISTAVELLDHLAKEIEEYDSPYVNKTIFIEQITPHLDTLLTALSQAHLASGGDATSSDGKGLSSDANADPSESRARERYIAKFSRKSPVYEDCQMLSTSGELLCYCDLKKVKWYLEKKLAVQVNEGDQPKVIKLLFEHRRGDQETEDGKFYLSNRANQCVACGETGNYLRYRIVPTCYRKFFPLKFKSHRSHDIVLLCVNCHEVAAQHANRLKTEM